MPEPGGESERVGEAEESEREPALVLAIQMYLCPSLLVHSTCTADTVRQQAAAPATRRTLGESVE